MAEVTQENKGVKIVKRIFTVVAVVILTFLTGIVIYVMSAGMHGKVADVFGISVLKVITGSMEPSIHTGDYIIVKKCDTSTLKEDDIICFYSADSAIYGMPNTHRIVKVNDDGSFVTKGDANKYEDTVTVSPDKIIGKYSGKVRFLRWINSFANAKKLIFLGIIIAMTIAAVYEVKTITQIAAECKADKQKRLEEEKQRLIRQYIDEEKKRLYEEGYQPEKEDNDKYGKGGAAD